MFEKIKKKNFVPSGEKLNREKKMKNEPQLQPRVQIQHAYVSNRWDEPFFEFFPFSCNQIQF